MSLALSLLPFNRLFAPAAGFVSPAGPATTEAPSRACVRAPPLHSAYDHLGSTSLITNAHGRRLDRLVYSPWGVPLTGNFNRTRFGYTGHQREVATGNWYSVWRYLDPRAGRWTQRDPAGALESDLNAYRYVLNAPLTLSDPEGLNPGQPAWWQERYGGTVDNQSSRAITVSGNRNDDGRQVLLLLPAKTRSKGYFGKDFNDIDAIWPNPSTSMIAVDQSQFVRIDGSFKVRDAVPIFGGGIATIRDRAQCPSPLPILFPVPFPALLSVEGYSDYFDASRAAREFPIGP